MLKKNTNLIIAQNIISNSVRDKCPLAKVFQIAGLEVKNLKTRHLPKNQVQGGILFVISELTPISQTEIANTLFIDKVSLSKMLLALEKKKIIEIVKTENRRTKFWKLTEKGNSLLHKLTVIDRQIETKLKKDVESTGHDCSILIDSLRALLIKSSPND